MYVAQCIWLFAFMSLSMFVTPVFGQYKRTNLVSDQAGMAAIHDQHYSTQSCHHRGRQIERWRRLHGFAIAVNTSGQAFLFAPDDGRNSRVDLFDGTFTFMQSFSDPGIPKGFAPYGIRGINGSQTLCGSWFLFTRRGSNVIRMEQVNFPQTDLGPLSTPLPRVARFPLAGVPTANHSTARRGGEPASILCV